MILINNRYNTDGGYFSGRSGQSVSSAPIGIKKDDTMNKLYNLYTYEQFDNIMWRAIWSAGHHPDDLAYGSWSFRDMYQKCDNLQEVAMIVNHNNNDLDEKIDFNVTVESYEEWVKEVVNESIICNVKRFVNKKPIKEWLQSMYNTFRMAEFTSEKFDGMIFRYLQTGKVEVA